MAIAVSVEGGLLLSKGIIMRVLPSAVRSSSSERVDGDETSRTAAMTVVHGRASRALMNPRPMPFDAT
jgi:hypothetical protein